MKLKNRVLAILFSISILCGCTIPVFAAATENLDPAYTPITAVGGMGGVVMYDVSTEEETFIPVENYYNGTRSAEQLPANSEVPTPRVVLPPDLRKPVNNTSLDEYKSIVLLQITYANGLASTATGFVVDSEHIVTAAHCLYQPDGVGWAKKIDVYRGASNGSYFGSKLTNSSEYGKMYVGGDYIKYIDNPDKRVHDDWGVFSVSTPMTNTPAYTVTPANALSDIKDYTWATTGYPDDLANTGVEGIKRLMYTAPGTVMTEVPLPRFSVLAYMNIDAAGGQSGSPIYRYIYGRGYIVSAILVAGDNYQTEVLLINDYISDFISSV